MPKRTFGSKASEWPIAIASVSMIAHLVGGKAIRDALFFSTFPMAKLPLIAVASVVPTLLLALVAPRIILRVGPAQTITGAYLLSASLHLVEWALLTSAHREAVAVMLYVHFMMVPVMTSGFWSVLSEDVDPRASRRKMTQAAMTASVGGVFGALLAARSDVRVMIPLLAAFHVCCALATHNLRATEVRGGARPGSVGPVPKHLDPAVARRAMARAKPYLISLAVAVAVLAMSAAVLDFYFKGQVKLAHPGLDEQKQFYSIFYLSTSLLALGLQLTLSRFALARLGLVRTTALLPVSVTLGGVGILAAPGLAMATLAFGSERVLRNSLFRTAYEPLYNAVPASENNTYKTVVDVGSERVGDALGYSAAWAVGAVGMLNADRVSRFQAILALVLSFGALVFGRSIHARYLKCLKGNLDDRVIELDPTEILDTATMNIITDVQAKTWHEPDVSSGSRPLVEQIGALAEGDLEQTRRVLGGDNVIAPGLVSFVIPLLAREDTSDLAMQALRRVASVCTGQLVDQLMNPQVDLRVRRRIPRVLRDCSSARAVDGLMAGLEDQHFEVCLECGRNLARMREENPLLPVEQDRVLKRIAIEVDVEQPTWVVRQLVDADGEAPDSTPLLDDKLRKRADRSLEHVFNLMSLILPNEPVRMAFRALHTADPALRGTALEYLETVLPRSIRDRLWRFIEVKGPVIHQSRSKDLALAALREQQRLVEIQLAALQQKPHASSEAPPG